MIIKLARWLPMTSILVVIGRIYCHQIKFNYFKKTKAFSCNFIVFLESTLNCEHFEKTTSLIASVFQKWLSPKDVVT